MGAIVDEISLDVARQVRQPLGEGQLQAAQKRGSSNIDAVIAMYAGNEAQMRYRDLEREEDFIEARQFYQKAISLDPNYCLAYLRLGDLYEARFVETSQPDDLRAMVQAYQKAHNLNPSVPQVHAGLGWAYFHQGQFDSAYASFKKAMALAPDDAEVNFGAALKSADLHIEIFLSSANKDEACGK